MFKGIAYHARGLTLAEFVADAVVCFLAMMLAARQLSAENLSYHANSFDFSQVLLPAACFALVMSAMYAFVGLYRSGAMAVSVPALLGRALLAVCMGASLAYLALSFRGQGDFALPLLGRSMLYISLGALLVRSLAVLARRAAIGARRVLIVGTGPEALAVASGVRASGRANVTVVGFYPVGMDAQSERKDIFPRSLSIDQVTRAQRVDEIIVAVREQRGGGVPMEQLLACRIRGVQVLDLAGFLERTHGEVPTDSLKASWLVYGHGFVQGPVRKLVKRVFDLVVASTLLTLALPVLLCSMLAIRIESPGPLIYRQERVGLAGRRFMCCKLRSMRVDAEQDGVARWATRGDSRVTRVGAVLRKCRIDELPQLLSVLSGEMSMVGPRPERPEFVSELRELVPFYDIRHSVKPGVTGWAQVRYGYCADLADARRKHQFDLFYVKNNSLLLDLLVLIETVSVVLFREGAH